LVNLFTMKHFLEVDIEVVLLSNSWIWYYTEYNIYCGPYYFLDII
jgi:hypothetical protein